MRGSVKKEITPNNGVHILHVCKVFWPVKGGVQVVVQRICEGLRGSNWKFTIVSTSTDQTGRQSLPYGTLNNAKSYGELLSLPLAPGVFIRMWRQFRRNNLVAVHYPFPLADIAISVYPFKMPPLVVYWHSEIVTQRFAGWLMAPFTRIMLRRAAKVICSSPNLIKYSGYLRRHEHKCEVIPFGLAMPDIGTDLVLPGNCDYFIVVGRHVPYKGVDVVLKAFSLSHSQFGLKIVGQGPKLSDNVALADRLGLGDRVEFVTNVDDEAVAEIIRNCRALLLPSRFPSEAFALVQVEAMAYGRPIINTDLKSGVPWVARHEKEAITVQPDSAEQLAEAIDRFSQDDALVNKLGRGAVDRYQNTFSLDQFCQKTAALYTSLAN